MPSEAAGVGGRPIDLEARLEAARKDKLVAQMPALRRLRTVIRVFVVLGILGQLFTIPFGFFLRTQVKAVVDALDLGALSVSAFWLYAVVSCISIAASWLQLVFYFRFLKQFRESQSSALQDTVLVLKGLILFGLLTTVVVVALQGAMFQNLTAVATTAGMLALGFLLQLVVLHYVKTAQAEVPVLRAAAGEQSSAEDYAGWKPLFLKLLAATTILNVVGYLMAG